MARARSHRTTTWKNNGLQIITREAAQWDAFIQKYPMRKLTCSAHPSAQSVGRAQTRRSRAKASCQALCSPASGLHARFCKASCRTSVRDIVTLRTGNEFEDADIAGIVTRDLCWMQPCLARSSMECCGMARDFCFTINVLHVFIIRWILGSTVRRLCARLWALATGPSSGLALGLPRTTASACGQL